MVQSLWKTVCESLKKLNIKLPYHPAVPLLGIYPREVKSHFYAKTCIQVFIAALFIIAQNWRQATCLSTGEGTDKMWYIHIVTYYSALKRNELIAQTT